MRELSFDDATNIRRLSALPKHMLVLPALLVATRLLPSYVRFHAKTGRGDAARVLALHAALRRDLTGVESLRDEEVLDAALEAEAMVPQEDEGWDDETQAYAEDAVAALAYAFRARAANSAREANCALGHGWAAIDHFVLAKYDQPIGGAVKERAVALHPLIQAELARIDRDLCDAEALSKEPFDGAKLEALLQRAEREAATFFVVSA